MKPTHRLNVVPEIAGAPPVVCDDADQSGCITRRLVALMKKEIKHLGDKAAVLIIDMGQFLDSNNVEDEYHKNIEEDFQIKVSFVERKDVNKQNRTCFMLGECGKLVIGVY